MKKIQKNNIINFPNNTMKIGKLYTFFASEPLDTETIEKRLNTKTNLIKIFENQQIDYKKEVKLSSKRDKWSFRTSEDLSKTMATKSTFRKLSKATIETLAIIVYHQPVTRSEIEEIWA